MKYQLLYPDERTVSGEQLMEWACDYYGCDAEDIGTVDQAIDCLQDAGEITLGNHGNPLDFPAE